MGEWFENITLMFINEYILVYDSVLQDHYIYNYVKYLNLNIKELDLLKDLVQHYKVTNNLSNIKAVSFQNTTEVI